MISGMGMGETSTQLLELLTLAIPKLLTHDRHWRVHSMGLYYKATLTLSRSGLSSLHTGALTHSCKHTYYW